MSLSPKVQLPLLTLLPQALGDRRTESRRDQESAAAEMANSEKMIEDFPFITSVKVGMNESLMLAVRMTQG